MTDTTPGAFTTPEIYSDLPLEPKRNEAAFFRFNEYSTTFARMIAARSTRTPLVLGISGKWGSGKTTLLRLIQSKVESSRFLDDNLSKVEFVGPAEEQRDASASFRRCRTVWFDAWKYADEDSLLAALIRAILSEMARGDWKDRLKGVALDKFFPRRDVLATFLGMFKFKLAEAGLEFTPDLDAHKTETPFAQHKAFFDDFSEAFDELLAAWVHGAPKRELDKNPDRYQDNGLAIFIDDLDRCLPAKAMQVLEAVKLFLDKPGVAFVIGADEDVIRRAVEAHYEKEGVKDIAARDYLDKVFQIRFSLPPLRSGQVGDYMRAGLSLPADLQSSVDLILAGSETNPRRIKTTLNYLQVNWAMLKNSGQASDDLYPDFVRWLLIELASADAEKPEVNFASRVRNIDDLDLRFKFVADAMTWARADARAGAAEVSEVLLKTYQDFAPFLRLRRVLRQGGFSNKVNPAVLDQFVYWSAQAFEGPAPEVTVEVSKEKGALSGVALGTSWAVGDLRGILKLGGIEFIEIPAGKFLMGSRPDNPLERENEQPQHPVEIGRAYRIGHYPVTNAQYRAFTEAARKDWKTAAPDDHPAVNVSWRDAVAYCDWLTKKLCEAGELTESDVIRLPTEAEWEKAARGEYGNEWPWGNEWDAGKCNSREGGKGDTTPVGAYSREGDSPYGVADMAGNVWEWCSSLFKPYPYEIDDREDLKADGSRVLRGGAWSGSRYGARAACRSRNRPFDAIVNVGFRVVAASHFSLKLCQ